MSVEDSQLQEIRTYPSSANLNLSLASRGNALSSKGRKYMEYGTSPDVAITIAVPPTIRMHAFRWHLLPTAPRIIAQLRTWEKSYFWLEFFYIAPVNLLCGVPGRGLEPLRISPPDPKSGAYTNFATPANCDTSNVAVLAASGKLHL